MWCAIGERLDNECHDEIGHARVSRAAIVSEGLVIETQRRHFLVEHEGTIVRCIAKGRQLEIACGDRVGFTCEADGGGVISTITARASVFYRADAHKQKVVAANVTQVVCVIASDPPFAPELLDRWLIAAEAAGVRAVVLCNKSDLESAPKVLLEVSQRYAPLGYSVVPLHAKASADALKPLLHGQRSVLIGQSGMGKSTILNALVGADVRAVGPLSAVRAAGTHTTTHSRLFHLESDEERLTWVIDSPGMQVFGVAHLARREIERAFPEFAAFAGKCRFRNCQHHNEPDCEIKTAVARGAISPLRFQNFHVLCAEAAA